MDSLEIIILCGCALLCIFSLYVGVLFVLSIRRLELVVERLRRLAIGRGTPDDRDELEHFTAYTVRLSEYRIEERDGRR